MFRVPVGYTPPFIGRWGLLGWPSCNNRTVYKYLPLTIAQVRVFKRLVLPGCAGVLSQQDKSWGIWTILLVVPATVFHTLSWRITSLYGSGTVTPRRSSFRKAAVDIHEYIAWLRTTDSFGLVRNVVRDISARHVVSFNLSNRSVLSRLTTRFHPWQYPIIWREKFVCYCQFGLCDLLKPLSRSHKSPDIQKLGFSILQHTRAPIVINGRYGDRGTYWLKLTKSHDRVTWLLQTVVCRLEAQKYLHLYRGQCTVIPPNNSLLEKRKVILSLIVGGHD